MKVVSNEKGLSLEIIKDHQLTDSDDVTPMLGGDDSNPTWEEYLNDFKEEYRPHVLLIRKSIEENGLMGYTGQEASEFNFKFSDGQFWSFSWRAWGDLMQSIINKNEGYMAYYM